MAQLNNLLVTGDSRFLNTVYGNITSSNGIHIATMGSTSTSTAFVVTAEGINSLYDGLIIYCKNTVVTSATNCTLDVNGLGAKRIWLSQANSYCTSHWGLNNAYLFVYNGTDQRWELQQGRDTNSDSNAMFIRYYNNVKAKAAITAEKIIVGGADGYQVAASGITFNISYPILWTNAAVSSGSSNYSNMYSQVYDRNLTNVKSGYASAANKAQYLVVTISGSTATVDSSIITDTLPNTEDGKVYIYLGKLGAQSTGANYFLFEPVHPMFWYKNGAVRPYVNDSATVNGHTVESDVPSSAIFTDEKVTQTKTTISDDNEYKILFSASTDNDTKTESAKKYQYFLFNPAYGRVTLDSIKGGGITYVGSSARYTHTEGYYTSVLSDYSHAEGASSVASGQKSHAEGGGTTAHGQSSHAEGGNTLASGDESHSEGLLTTASAQGSHTEGYLTSASGYASHAEGFKSYATFSYAHAEGGDGTSAGGYASGKGSHAEGVLTTASGICAHAEGNRTSAYGDYSHAIGFKSTASGNYSHAEGGDGTSAGGLASGVSSHAEGCKTRATNTASHAEGYNTSSTSGASHAEGLGTLASAARAHAEGNNTKATNSQAHAEGADTTASGEDSHAEGAATSAAGIYSHAEGQATCATNQASHAQNYATVAKGVASSSMGNGTIASGFAQTVEGVYNVEDLDNKYVHIIGGGSDNSNRKNILTVNWDGDVCANSYGPIVHNAITHRNVYRGKNLGSTVTTDQYNAIDAGTFEDLYIGDYWVMDYDGTNTVKFYIVDFDPYIGKGSSGATATTKHHIMLFPSKPLPTSTRFTMEAPSTNDAGYKGCNFRLNVLPNIITKLNTWFGQDHILKHPEYLSTQAGTSGPGTAKVVNDCAAELFSVINIFGYQPVAEGSGRMTSYMNAGYTLDLSILPLFRYANLHKLLDDRNRFVFRDIENTGYWMRYNLGNCLFSRIADTEENAYPYFLLCKSNT